MSLGDGRIIVETIGDVYVHEFVTSSIRHEGKCGCATGSIPAWSGLLVAVAAVVIMAPAGTRPRSSALRRGMRRR
jgi:hypothetical protein